MMRLWNVLGCVIALATLPSLTGAPAWAKGHGSGAVTPCDLSGVNPVLHKRIFRTAESAAKYGFVKGSDGNWTVMPNCHVNH